MLLAEFVSLTFLPSVMVERANVHLVAPTPITLNPFVLVRVVEPFDSGVALWTFDTALTVVPADAIL